MRTKSFKGIVLILALLIGRWLGYGQGNFVNLDFESPIPPLPANPSTQVPISNALPGWSGFIGTFQVDQVSYDSLSLGGAVISLNDAKTGLGVLPLQGQFSAFLFGGSINSATISQTGLVPADARSLLFYAGTYDGGHNGPFAVSLGGKTISMVPMASFPAYTLYGGDVSAMAGQVATLSFTALPVVVVPNMFLLDNIQFSTQPIPEPSIVCLVALGASLLGWLGRKRART